MYKFTQGVQLSELMLLIKFDKTRAGETGNVAQKGGKTLEKTRIQGNVLALWTVKYSHIIFLSLCILLIAKTMQCCNNYFKAWLILTAPINPRSIKTTEWGAWSYFLPLSGF